MAGSDQSANLGGMLSQIGQTLGTPMDITSLTNSMRNTFRPEVDPNDPTSLQNYARWAGRVGKPEEALAYNKQASDMRDAEKQLGIKKAALAMQSQYQQAIANKDAALAGRIKEAAGKFSAQTGVDALSGLAQIDARERAANSEERAAQAAQYAQQQQAIAASDKEYRGKWLSASPEEKETLRTEMADKGLAGTVLSLEAADRAITTFNQSQEDRRETNVPLSADEIKSAEDVVASMTSSGPGGAKLAALMNKKIEAIKNDSVLSNKMKRQRINEVTRSAYNYNIGQASSADSLARTLASKKPSDEQLKMPAEWTVDYMQKQINELEPGWGSWLFGKKDEETKKLNAALEAGGTDLARRAASYMTTYPQLSVEQAITLAANQSGEVSTDSLNSGSTKVIKYDANGKRVTTND